MTELAEVPWEEVNAINEFLNFEILNVFSLYRGCASKEPRANGFITLMGWP